MPRYIDADKANELLEEARVAGMIDMYDCEQRGINFDEAIECVNSVPTEDVVPVVRCKDCRNCEKSHFTLSEEYICLYTLKTTTLDDYCSVAVKRDEDVD